MEHYINAFKKYAVFAGRATRTEYWMFILFNFLAQIILSLISLIPFLVILKLIYSLAIIIPTLSITCRRLHDINRSGWWQLLPAICLGLLIIFAVSAGTTLMMYPSYNGSGLLVAMGVVGLVALVSGIVLFVFMCLDSTPGVNRFGLNPKGIGNPEPAIAAAGNVDTAAVDATATTEEPQEVNKNF